jgi:hypothetical protein
MAAPARKFAKKVTRAWRATGPLRPTRRDADAADAGDVAPER